MTVASPCPTSTKITVVAPEEAPEAPVPAPPDAVELGGVTAGAGRGDFGVRAGDGSVGGGDAGGACVVAADPQPASSTAAASTEPKVLPVRIPAAYHRVTMEPRVGRSPSTVTQEAPVPDDQSMDAFIRGVPKAELHVHLEGTLEPEMLLELGERNGVALRCSTAEECRAAYHFDDLQHFLDLYYEGVAVLVTERDFYELTAAYLQRAHADGARHVEVFFDPQSHTSRGIPFAMVVEGIRRALVEAEQQLGVSSRLIMCFLRDKSAASAMITLETARPYRHIIAGVGLDSAEVGHPPREFEDVFRVAREAGFRCVAHAGEEGPAEYITEALDLLKAERIDHGVRAGDDPELQRRLAREQTPLTMCPLSNLELQVTPDLSQHPLKRLLDAGLRVTVSSDDPAYFDGYLAANYAAVQRALDLDRDDIAALARNSITASWLPATRQAQLLAEIDAFVAAAS
jgi:adenosine deaminase